MVSIVETFLWIAKVVGVEVGLLLEFAQHIGKRGKKKGGGKKGREAPVVGAGLPLGSLLQYTFALGSRTEWKSLQLCSPWSNTVCDLR